MIDAGKKFGVTDFVDAKKCGDKSIGQVDISIINQLTSKWQYIWLVGFLLLDY